MPFDILSAITSGAVEALVGAVTKSAAAHLFGGHEDEFINTEVIGTSFARHLVEVANWSSTLPVFGLSRPTDTEEISIPLRFDEQRRFRRHGAVSEELSESALLAGPHHCILLGEPGAGKTTTLKRLIRMLLTEDRSSAADTYEMPIVLRLHLLSREVPLLTAIANVMGLPWHHLTYHPNTKAPLQPPEDWIGGRSLTHVIPALLDEAGVLLVFDGLDEVPGDTRANRQNEIIELGFKLSRAKIITSCRTGDYSSVFDGFDIFEVCPLNTAQVELIAARWLGESRKFLEHLSKLPYADVVNRPLLLTQLIVLFRRDGYLPQKPASVCQRLVELLLERWDIERRIERSSRYAGFDATRKADLLAAIAYQLTYVIQSQVFTAADLTQVYVAVCDLFDLPVGEARQVAAELQTHNGLIVQVTDDKYEFSHLSLQEYLCASYIVRDPLGEKVRHYLAAYPAPVAVAVALAPDSSKWLSSIVFRWAPYMTANSARSFIARIVTERAVFRKSWFLGAAVMKLYVQFGHRDDVIAVLDQFIREKNVTESISDALKIYKEERTSEWGVWFTLARPVTDDVGYPVPSQIGLTAAAYAHVIGGVGADAAPT